MLLPCKPPNHATMRNRTHRLAAEIENQVEAPPKIDAEPNLEPDMIVLIDGARIRAAPGWAVWRPRLRI
jgi:hypothetical protein